MSADLLLVDRPRDGVALLTLNRPDKKNALSISLRDRISDVLDEVAEDESVRAVVITGAGDTFSAGFDLREFGAAATDEALNARLWESSDRYHRRVLAFPLPPVAAVNGAAIAGGFDLATMCDIRVAADSARFARPEGSFGPVMYDHLHDLVGSAVARDLTLTRRSIDAQEALRMCLVTQVVEDDELMATAIALAGQVADAPRHLLLDHKAAMLARSAVHDIGSRAR